MTADRSCSVSAPSLPPTPDHELDFSPSMRWVHTAVFRRRHWRGLVEFVPGETLAAVAGRGELGDREWHLVGEAYRRIHAVRFPTALRVDFGPDRLELTYRSGRPAERQGRCSRACDPG